MFARHCFAPPNAPESGSNNGIFPTSADRLMVCGCFLFCFFLSRGGGAGRGNGGMRRSCPLWQRGGFCCLSFFVGVVGKICRHGDFSLSTSLPSLYSLLSSLLYSVWRFSYSFVSKPPVKIRYIFRLSRQSCWRSFIYIVGV